MFHPGQPASLLIGVARGAWSFLQSWEKARAGGGLGGHSGRWLACGLGEGSRRLQAGAEAPRLFLFNFCKVKLGSGTYSKVGNKFSDASRCYLSS